MFKLFNLTADLGKRRISMLKKISFIVVVLVALATNVFADDYAYKYLLEKEGCGKITVVSKDKAATYLAIEMRKLGWKITTLFSTSPKDTTLTFETKYVNNGGQALEITPVKNAWDRKQSIPKILSKELKRASGEVFLRMLNS